MIRTIVFYLIFTLYSALIFAQDAVYSLDFISNWNSTTHPTTNFPNDAHWSTLTGTTHNSNISFWDFDQLASQGVKEVAENGDASFITQDINSEINNNNAYKVISLPLGFGNIFTFESIEVKYDFPYISLMTMIAPSPDWLAEIHNVKLTDDTGAWKNTISIDVYATDAGTDSGTTYISPNIPTVPPENISSLQNTPPFSDQIVATFTFSLSQVLAVNDSELNNSFSIYPIPCKDSFFIKNSANNILNKVEIFSVAGKKVKEFIVSPKNDLFNISDLADGMYFLKLSSEKGNVIKKIVVQ